MTAASATQQRTHPIFERVHVTCEGRSKTTPSKDCFVFVGPTAEEVQGAYEYEAEHCNGVSEAVPASGPVHDGNGTFVLYAKMPARNSHVTEPFREFLNSISGQWR